MHFTKFFCCGLLAVLLMSRESSTQQVFCGNALRKILNEICIDGFHPLLRSTIKRSGNYNNIVPQLSGYGDSDTDNDILPLSYSALYMDPMFGEYANTMAQTRRQRNGVYDDCCRRGCSFDELALYCK